MTHICKATQVLICSLLVARNYRQLKELFRSKARKKTERERGRQRTKESKLQISNEREKIDLKPTDPGVRVV
jgi:hypothetical protein